MKYVLALWFIVTAVLQVNALELEDAPPAEMIMMDFSDDGWNSDTVGEIVGSVEESPSITIEDNIDPSAYLSSGSLKIALLVPKKVIGTYADSVTNAVISYLIRKDQYFQVEVFDTGDEMEGNIVNKLSEAKAKGFSFVIAPMTTRGASVLCNVATDQLIFIPTINRREMELISSNVIFGGLDYQKQIDMLLGYANDKIAIFGDGSRLAESLENSIKQSAYEKVVYVKEIENIKTNLSSLLRRNGKLKKSSIFLNMPVVKSSLLASQIRQNDITPQVLLSTQVNYNPLLFKLTQYQDREYFYIANSIANFDPVLLDINYLLGNQSAYNWLDYATSIGLDYVLSSQLGAGQRLFDEEISENQIVYKVRLEKAGTSSFEPIGDGQFYY